MKSLAPHAGHVSNSDTADWGGVEPMNMVAVQMFPLKNEGDVQPGSPNGTRLEPRLDFR